MLRIIHIMIWRRHGSIIGHLLPIKSTIRRDKIIIAFILSVPLALLQLPDVLLYINLLAISLRLGYFLPLFRVILLHLVKLR